MAEAVAEVDTPPEETPKRSKKGLLIAVAVLVLGGAGAGGWYFMGSSGAPEEVAEEPVALAPAIYVSFEPPFVVNFEANGMVRFLQVAVQVMTRDLHTSELLKQHDPVIRNDMLLLLGNQQYETISTREGKEQLRLEALEAVRHVVKANGGEPEAVETVLFTSFVMQ